MSTALKSRLSDLGERAGATFVQAFLATIIVQKDVTERTALYTAVVAGALALAKFLLVRVTAYLRKRPDTPTT